MGEVLCLHTKSFSLTTSGWVGMVKRGLFGQNYICWDLLKLLVVLEPSPLPHLISSPAGTDHLLILRGPVATAHSFGGEWDFDGVWLRMQFLF